MGTRSIVRVFEDDAELLTVYRHYEGYPSCMGAAVKRLFGKIRVVNGGRGDDGPDMVNGAGRVAAHVVTALDKLGVGPSILPTGCQDAGQEYEYHVRCPGFQACDAASQKGKRGIPVVLEGYLVTRKGLTKLAKIDQDEEEES